MAVNLSPVGGVAAQFFTNSGTPLTGGKIFTYLAGTTTPATTYTNSQGNVQWTNPIVLNAAGRVPSGGEIWLTDGLLYKFVLKDADDVTIATYDNISGINSNFVAFVNQQEIVTATAGQTVFNLGISYQPGTNSLSVFVDGVNQYGPGAQYAYTETDADTVTFTSGLHVGAEVKFTTTQQQSAGAVDAQQVSYTPPFANSVTTNVEAKLAQYVSIQDFGASPSASAVANTTAITAALTYAGAQKCGVYVPGASSAYQINNDLTVPDGVTVFGDGWGSFIQQTVLNKDVFIAGDCNTFKNLRLKVADGDDTEFVNCVFANSVNNLTVESCFLEPGDLGGVGVHIRGVKNSQIRGNRIYGGKFTSGTAAAASAADILLYSSSTSERHIIEGNHCLSNNSQGIYAGALGYDGDIIIANNICVTLDPTTCTETGTWSLAANGGNRRHGIEVTYSNAQAGIPRTVVDGNICRNTRWTGIYKNDLSQGEIIISNNLCDLNGYDVSTPLTGGIYVEAAGKVTVIGNTVSNFQSTLTGVGGLTLNQVSSENQPSLIANNKVIGSLGAGIAVGTFAKLLYIVDNLLTANAGIDIYVSNNPDPDASGHTIANNRIFRSSGTTIQGIFVDQQTSTRATVIKNNQIRGFNNSNNSATNTGIYVRNTSNLTQVDSNIIENFYNAFYSDSFYSAGRMSDRVIQNNVIRNCAVGFDVSAGNNNLNTLPLVGNVFISTTTQVANTLGFAVGRIVQRLGDNFVWQSTAVPTVGSWAVGDRSINSAPAVGQPKAWVCTVTGAPGTWVSEGNL
jgi:hypothetical protein